MVKYYFSVTERERLNEMKDYSQLGEQEKLIHIFNQIGLTTGDSLEFGGSDSVSASNTRWLHNITHLGRFLDVKPRSELVAREFITAENINTLFEKYKLSNCDLVSIDIDGNDYWVWKALKYRPRVVIIEFNSDLAKDKSVTIKYDPNFIHQLTSYYGASWLALKKLALEKNYTLVDATRLNMIFVADEEMNNMKDVSYVIDYNVTKNWKHDNREWMDV